MVERNAKTPINFKSYNTCIFKLELTTNSTAINLTERRLRTVQGKENLLP